MIRRLRLPSLVIIVILVALSSAALIPGGQVLLDPTGTPAKVISATSTTHLSQVTTPTPSKRLVQKITLTPTPDKIKPTPISLIAQAGNSDGIVLIGILIVGIIIVPILLRRKEWRGN